MGLGTWVQRRTSVDYVFTLRRFEGETSNLMKLREPDMAKLAPQSGHVSNFCSPTGTVIEPANAERF